VLDNQASTLAYLTGLAEGFQKSQPKLLPGHLNQSETGHFGNLMLRAIAPQALHQALQDKVTVGFENHVNEVDNDNSPDVSQAELADDFFGRFQVVLRDRLFEVAPRPHKLSGVHIDYRHGLRAVNDQ
jgi:hypothetical protein